jgi:mycothiol synthase
MINNLLPSGYRIRPAVLEDAPAINELICAYDLYMTGEAHHTEIELLQEWQRTDFQLDQDTWVIIAPQPGLSEGKVVGYQEISNRSEHAFLNGDGYVHPEYTNLGIGTVMLRLLETRARQHIPLAPPEQRVFIRNGVDGIDLAACELHEHEDYKPVRFLWHMEIHLHDSPPKPAWPVEFEVQNLNPGEDVRRVFDTLEEAFRDHWGYTPWNFDNWQRRMCSEDNFDPSLWFLAVCDSQIAGAAVCRQLDERIGWVSQLGVRPAWRRCGLGKALLQTAFQAFYQRGIQLVRLGVDAQNPTGATRLYENSGMHVSHRFIVYEKELRPGNE